MKQFSDRDRYGAFGHRRRVAHFTVFRSRRRRRVRVLLVIACAGGFLAPFGVNYLRDLLEKPVAARSLSPYSRTVGSSLSNSFASGPIPICSGWIRLRSTCLVDGDTGWEHSVKWRLDRVDTPELSNPGCAQERRKAVSARDRLQELMRSGYRIEWLGSTDRFGRQLVNIRLVDGSDAGRVLLHEGLAQPWPNSGNVWCGR